MKTQIYNLFVLVLGLALLSSTSGVAAQDVHHSLLSDVDNIAEMGFHIDVATLENTIDTSSFNPESPDPAGIAYIEVKGKLLISDSEVEETPLYANANLFETELSGSLVVTGTTSPGYSDEPTGLAYNPDNQHIFISDDGLDMVFEVAPGVDKKYGTEDDPPPINSFSTAAFGSGDPSGVAYDSIHDHLYIVDGVGKEVYKVDPATGAKLSNFDIGFITGVQDPEGIAYNHFGDTLFVVDKTNIIVEMTTSGLVIRIIDISAANGIRPAGLALAPPSGDSGADPEAWNFYIADRGVDSDDPDNPEDYNDGKVYEMDFQQITPGNLPPVVEAGPPQTITFPSETSVNLVPGASVSDATLPPPPSLTTTWSQVSGPHPVEFGNPSVVDTTASFPEPGVYVLRLTADDGELAPWDEVTITVNGPTGVVVESRVNASSDDAEERANTGFMLLTSNDLEMVYDPSPGLDQFVGIRFNGIGIPKGASVVNAYIQFKANESDSEATSLTIRGEDINNAPTFTTDNADISDRNSTSASVEWSPAPWTVNKVGFDQRTPNIAPIIEEIVGRSGWSSCNSLVIMFEGDGKRVADSYDLPNGTAPLLHIYADSGTTPVNQGPCVEAGPDQAITLPAVANLDGTVIDDGLPSGALTTTWTMESGPGTVTFGDDSAVDTTASFSTAGTYLLRLTATDGELSNWDEMTVEVAPQNFPPVVDAGLDQTIVWPNNEATLDGTVADDGLPSGVLTSSWSQVDGPGVVVFSPPDAAQTIATFSEMGTYVLRLTATDGELSNFDEVTVNVIDNEPPVVDAGLDQSVSILTGAALNGTVTDPTPTGVLTTTWTMEDGPGLVTFGDASAVDTTANFSEEGTYVLRLTAGDGYLTEFDEVTINVANLIYLPFITK